MSDRPEMISLQMVNRALTDPRFRKLCPEFASVKAPEKKAVGCGRCGSSGAQRSQTANFFSVASGLDAGALARMKSYFGVSKIMLNSRDVRTGVVSLKVV
jgi:hypothetical protein